MSVFGIKVHTKISIINYAGIKIFIFNVNKYARKFVGFLFLGNNIRTSCMIADEMSELDA